jgi:hypothetical protein
LRWPKEGGVDKLEVLRWPTDRARGWTADFVNSAPANGDLLAIVAIGSSVRPNVSSSDLDLIVITSGPAPRRITAPMEIDVWVFSRDVVHHELATGHDLLGAAVRFGKCLFDRDKYWQATADTWKDRLPFPSATVARNRALAAQQRLTKFLASGDTNAVEDQAVSYLTHMARTELLESGIYPASRPELPSQLRAAGKTQLANQMERLLRTGEIDNGLRQFLKKTA